MHVLISTMSTVPEVLWNDTSLTVVIQKYNRRIDAMSMPVHAYVCMYVRIVRTFNGAINVHTCTHA